MVIINCSTLHTVYNIQQSAMQGSNDTTHRLSHRTAATTRFSPEETDGAELFANDLIRRTLQAFTRPGNDERLMLIGQSHKVRNEEQYTKVQLKRNLLQETATVWTCMCNSREIKLLVCLVLLVKRIK